MDYQSLLMSAFHPKQTFVTRCDHFDIAGLQAHPHVEHQRDVYHA